MKESWLLIKRTPFPLSSIDSCSEVASDLFYVTGREVLRYRLVVHTMDTILIYISVLTAAYSLWLDEGYKRGLWVEQWKKLESA